MRQQVDKYVDALLLRKKRPRPFAPTEDEVEMLSVAINLTAGAPGNDEPRPAFVEQLRKQIERQHHAEAPEEPRPAWRVPARRRLLAAGALTVTGAAAGAAGGQLLALGSTANSASPAPEPDAPSELTPSRGSWQTVADSTQVPEGTTLPFDLGAVAGYVRRTSGRVQAVSGICTHQGCRLELTPARDELACPCHGATFTLAGMNLSHPRLMHRALPNLPRFAVREVGGRIQIYAPAQRTATDSDAATATATATDHPSTDRA